MSDSLQPPEDRRPRWEQAADERRSRGGLGLPANFTMPKWAPAVLFLCFFANSVRRLVQANDVSHAVWGAASALIFGLVLIQMARRNRKK